MHVLTWDPLKTSQIIFQLGHSTVITKLCTVYSTGFPSHHPHHPGVINLLQKHFKKANIDVRKMERQAAPKKKKDKMEVLVLSLV